MKIAKTDLYATDGVGVRRFIAAGDEVPPGVEVEDGDVDERGGSPSAAIAGTTLTTASIATIDPTRPVDEEEEGTTLSNEQIDALSGEQLDSALEDAGIDASTGGSLRDGSLSVDEKREALKASNE